MLLTLGDVAALVHRRRLAITVTFVVVMVAAAVVYKLVPREYRADVVLVPIEDVSADAGAVASPGMSQVAALLGGSAASNWRQESLAFLRSRQLARVTVQALGLLDELAPDTGEESVELRLARAVMRFRKQVIKVAEDRLTGIVTVSATADSPAAAVGIANRYVAEANRLARERALLDLGAAGKAQERELATATSIEVRAVLTHLMERNQKSLSLARARTDYAYRVIDPAMPGGREMRVFPRLMSFAAFGGMLAVALALAVALVIEIRSRRRQRA